ncbi:MAG: hypothetical protein ABJZ55_11120 [Fuerstiella sp.]
MNPLSRTLMFAGIAVATAGIAFVANNASQPDNVDGFADVGQMFFPDFQDVSSATSLTVVDFDAENRSTQSFAVQQNEAKLWVIPSHYDYPTEAADRLARTATSVMGIKKVAVTSRNKVDWKRYGVLAPDAEGASEADERGTRLQLADSSGNSLVDLIIGNKVPDQAGQYYVRVPEKSTTYISELSIDLSAKFSDWIQPDLLKLEPTDLVSVTLDGYSIDETRGTINPGEILNFKKEGLKTSGEWSLADLKPESEEFDASPITSLVTNLQQLKIVDVLPKPDGLSDNMRINPVVKQILQRQMGKLGYFFGPERAGDGERLYSNEGELLAGTDKGVQYTLYFGEITKDASKDIEVGLDDEDGAAADDSKTDDEQSKSEEGPRRYLLVKVDFNEELLGPKPVAPQEPVQPEILNEDAAEDATKDSAEEPEFDEPSDAKEKDSAPTEEDEEEATAVGEQAGEEPEAKQAGSEEKSGQENTGQEKTDPEKTDPEKADQEAAKPEGQADKQEPASDKSDVETQKTEEAKSEQEDAKPDPKLLAEAAYNAALQAHQQALLKYQAEKTAWDANAKAGQGKVAALSQRFSGWYYVISSDSFDKFRLNRKDVVSEKAAETPVEEDAATDPAAEEK